VRVFITGASGLLGRVLPRVFATEECYQSTHEQEDIGEPRIVTTIVNYKPDVIIHAAAMTDVDGCEVQPNVAFRVNEHGTRHVAEAAHRTGALLVYVSTDYVYDGTKGTAYIETDPTNPINVYGRSKLAGERAAQEAERWLVVRTSWLYGEGRPNFVTNVLEWIKTQPALRLVWDKQGSPTYVVDLAQTIRYLVDASITHEICHASGEGVCNWVEYGQEILKITGLQKEIQPITFDDLQRPATRPAHTGLHSAVLEKHGFPMRPWQEALREFLAIL